MSQGEGPKMIQFPNGTWMDPSQVAAIMIFDRVRVNVSWGSRPKMFGEDPYGPNGTYVHEVKFNTPEEAEAFRDALAKEVNSRARRLV